LDTVFAPLVLRRQEICRESMQALITVLYSVAAILASAFAFVELRMLWQFLRNRRAIRASFEGAATTPSPVDASPAPRVTIQIPLYNERTTAEQIIRAAAAQDYPRDRFDIQVLDDSTDETREIVARAVDEVRETGVRIEHIHRTNRHGYKAGALAEGMQKTDADFLALFDADFVPEPTFLRRLLIEERAFEDPKVAFVQARWAFGGKGKNLFSSALALLIDRHFFVQKPTRAYVGNVTAFNGSAGIWRRKAVEDAGGWSAETLTEDLDLSYRCALRGWRGAYVHRVAVLNEIPGHMRAFKMQQHRWAKGNAQCFKTLTRRVMAAKGVLRDRWDEAFLLAGYAIHPILLTNLLLWPWAVLYMDRALFWVLQLLMGVAILVAPVSFAITVIERDGRWSLQSLGEILAGICVGIGLMVNNSAGQLQGFAALGGEFVRTPKANPGVATPAKVATTRLYTSPLHWTFFAELAVIAYCIFGTALLFERGEGLWAIPLLFWAMCLGLVVQMQMSPRLA
jgi:cellulose synthase/poly-beta-1,6-N-acetylglucosamine synthase-like glycosyltransferase